MENNGWIKLHRKFLKWEWIQKPEMVSLFLQFLLLANHDTNQWQGQTIKRGQFITGLKSLSKTTGISPQTLRTCITRLKSTGEITSKSTNKFRLITIIKYSDYQDNEIKSTSKSTTKLTINQQSTNNQLTPNKNNKNDKNENNIILSEHSSQISPLIKEFEEINPTIKYNNKTQRKACEELISKFGYEKVVATLNYYKSIRGEKFSPVITTPYELQQKMGQLLTFYNKSTNKPKTIIL